MTFIESTLLNPSFHTQGVVKCVNLINKLSANPLDESLATLCPVSHQVGTSQNESTFELFTLSKTYADLVLASMEDNSHIWVIENIYKLLTCVEHEKCQFRVVVPLQILLHPKVTQYVNILKEKRANTAAFRSLILLHTLNWLYYTGTSSTSSIAFLPSQRLYSVLYAYPHLDTVAISNSDIVKSLFFKDEYFDNEIQLKLITRIAQKLFKQGGISSALFLSNLLELINDSTLLLDILKDFDGIWSDQHYYLFKWLKEVDPDLFENMAKQEPYSTLNINALLNTALTDIQLYDLILKLNASELDRISVYPNMDKAIYFGWAKAKTITNIENTVLIEKIATNVSIFCQYLFNKSSTTGIKSVLKKIAKNSYAGAGAYLFDYFYKKILGATKISNFQHLNDLNKLAFIALNVNKILDVSEPEYCVIEDASAYAKGWFDLAKLLPNIHKWHLMSFRADRKEPKFDNFLNGFNLSYSGYNPELNPDPYFGPESIYNPIDERGGFSLNTYLLLCKEYKINPWKKTGVEGANHKAALSLTYLYGSDVEAAKALIQEQLNSSTSKDKTSTRALRKAIHDAGQFYIPNVPAEDIRYWRPYFVRNEKIRGYAHYVLKFEKPSAWISDSELIKKVYSVLVPGLPPGLGEHAAHIIENGWRKSVIDEFVSLLPKAKKESLIPEVVLQHEGVLVTHLKPGDPSALYIGELSGCCQHINYGAGEGAAKQSYTQPWCSILKVSSQNNSLLAQSFIWLSKKGDTIVIDSLESVHSATSEALKDKVFPALEQWILKMTEQGYNVVLSDTYYGVTSALKRYLHKSGQLKKEVKASIRVTPWARLSYTDFHGSGVLFPAS